MRALLIAGPTASGKTALALSLADQFDGAIINTDSMQVYRDLSIITARPTADEMARAPHYLFGTVDAAENYSVARWLVDAGAALRSIEAAGRFPIFVGGTGLYFRALTHGLSDIPPVPEAVRSEVRDWAEGRAPEDIHARLAALDPETAATLRPSDPSGICGPWKCSRRQGVRFGPSMPSGRVPRCNRMRYSRFSSRRIAVFCVRGSTRALTA